jgi:hypothetical protein
MTRLLEGHIVDASDAEADDVESLRSEVRRLTAALSKAQLEARQARQESHSVQQALAALKKQLSPLYRALQLVFGELEGVDVDEGSFGTAPSGASPRVTAVWESWKSKLGGGCAKVIDALLLHGDLNTQQLSVATGYHRTSIPAFIFKLNKNGLLEKNGGRFSLKQL